MDDGFSPAIAHGMGHPPAPGGGNKKRVRYPDRRSGNADGAGNLTINFPGPPEGYHWLLERCVMNGASGTAILYVGSIIEDAIRDLFPTVVNAVVQETPPILVPGGSDMNFVFAGLPALGHAYVNVQYMIEKDG